MRHHLKPGSRKGKSVKNNLLLFKRERHYLWHLLFGNLTLYEVIITLIRLARMKGIRERLNQKLRNFIPNRKEVIKVELEFLFLFLFIFLFIGCPEPNSNQKYENHAFVVNKEKIGSGFRIKKNLFITAKHIVIDSSDNFYDVYIIIKDLVLSESSCL